MSLLCYVFVDIIHIIKIILLCDVLFVFEKYERKHKRIMLLTEAVFLCVVSIFTYFFNHPVAVLIISMVTLIVLLCLLYREKIYIVVISALWITFAIAMIDAMSTVLTDVISDLLYIRDENIVKVGAASISFLFVFILGNIYNKKYNEGIKTIGLFNLIWFTILAIIDAIVVMAMAGVTERENLVSNQILYSVAFVFVIIGMFIQLGAVILLFVQRNVYKEKKQITEKYLNEQKNHYEYLENREIETKKFRHDLRHHMQMLSNMAKNHQYEEFDQYMDTIEIKIDKFGKVITVQNEIVDAIINQYYAKAEQNGIKMEVKGRLPKVCAVDAYDLCTIFSNVLSNALEAAIETEEKLITVDCRYTDDNISIVVSNSFKNVGQFGDGHIRTRKEDVDYHGYGLENIKESIDKYNGILYIENDDSIFTLKIVFNDIEKR